MFCVVVDCFWCKGYYGVGMVEIFKIVGMSVGYIYNYFVSKEVIIELIVECDMEEMFLIFKEFVDKLGDCVIVLLDGFDRGVECYIDLN